MSNWHNVLRAINMASSTNVPKNPQIWWGSQLLTAVFVRIAAKIPKPREAAEDQGDNSVPLPQTLVRIPTEHAPTLQAQAEGLESEQNTSTIP